MRGVLDLFRDKKNPDLETKRRAAGENIFKMDIFSVLH